MSRRLSSRTPFSPGRRHARWPRQRGRARRGLRAQGENEAPSRARRRHGHFPGGCERSLPPAAPGLPASPAASPARGPRRSPFQGRVPGTPRPRTPPAARARAHSPAEQPCGRRLRTLRPPEASRELESPVRVRDRGGRGRGEAPGPALRGPGWGSQAGRPAATANEPAHSLGRRCQAHVPAPSTLGDVRRGDICSGSQTLIARRVWESKAFFWCSSPQSIRECLSGAKVFILVFADICIFFLSTGPSAVTWGNYILHK